jgi:hypothetical protein
MITKAWGTWELFQSLLSVLRVIGDRHGGLSIANIATRWVLDHPFVGAVIIGTSFHEMILINSQLTSTYHSPGARLGLSEHLDDNRRVFGFNLTSEDNSDIEEVLMRSNGRRVITIIGDCGAEYR